MIAAVSTDKAYVNVRLHPQALVAAVLRQALDEGRRFGGDQASPQQHWMVEYSAPNTNKPLHLGHLRNNVLGWSVTELLRFFGHRVTRINLVNDRGVHICKSMLAYRRWGEGTTPERAGKKGDHLVGEFYVLFDRHLGEEYAAWQKTPAAEAKLRPGCRERPAAPPRPPRPEGSGRPDAGQALFRRVQGPVLQHRVGARRRGARALAALGGRRRPRRSSSGAP